MIDTLESEQVNNPRYYQLGVPKWGKAIEKLCILLIISKPGQHANRCTATGKILILKLNKSNKWMRLSGCSAVLIQVRFCCCFKTWGCKIAGGKSYTSDRFQTLSDTQLPQVNSFLTDCASKQPWCSCTDHLKHILCILHNKFRKKLIPHQFLVCKDDVTEFLFSTGHV